MNGYLARLMRQSAVRIEDDASPKFQLPVPASDPVTAAADVIEEETLREAQGQQELSSPVIRVPDAQSTTARPDQPPVENDSDAEATPERERRWPPESIESRQSAESAIPFVSIRQTKASSIPDDRIPAARANLAPDESRADEAIFSSAPTAREIVQEVVAWVADTKSPAGREKSTNRTAGIGPVADVTPAFSPEESPDSNDSPARRAFSREDDWEKTDLPEGSFFHSAEDHSTASPISKAEAWSVQIESIQLTIEEPAAKPVPAPIALRETAAAVAAPSGFTPSQLRRHYLRPF